MPFLPKSSSIIGNPKNQTRGRDFQLNAEKSLSDLTKTSAAFDFDGNSDIWANVVNLTFQYHHLNVFLTKGSSARHTSCFDAARAAIVMLDKLVCNSSQAHNEIIWWV
jgi:hypothetical protein